MLLSFSVLLANWLLNQFSMTTRSSSTPITYIRRLCFFFLSLRCFWEWYRGRIIDLDLPKLKSIEMGAQALWIDGRDGQRTIKYKPYNYKNTLTMRSEWSVTHIIVDLPSLTIFKGKKYNFEFIGSVILDSVVSFSLRIRYP